MRSHLCFALCFLLFVDLSTGSLLKNFFVVSTTSAIAADTQNTKNSDSNMFVGNTVISENTPQTIPSVLRDPPKPQKLTVHRSVGANCALYAKSVTGIVTGAPVASQTLTYAKKAGYETSTEEPVVGGIGVTNEGSVGHVFVVKEVKDGKVLTSERNYPVRSRWLAIDDPRIKGFVLPK